MKDKEILFWKLAAIGVAAVYVYKVTKANGGTLANNPMGVNLNPEKVATLASQFAPREWRPQAKYLGQKVLERIVK